jgi:hypothetical protein
MPATNDSYRSPEDDKSPCVHGALVTPSDSTDLVRASRALYVGGAGNVQVTMFDGASPPLVITNLGVGWHPIRVTRVWATNTTATNIVAFS